MITYVKQINILKPIFSKTPTFRYGEKNAPQKNPDIPSLVYIIFETKYF